MAACAVPLLCYFGLLCFNDSPMIEIPSENKPGAAYSCWLAAALYAATMLDYEILAIEPSAAFLAPPSAVFEAMSSPDRV